MSKIRIEIGDIVDSMPGVYGLSVFSSMPDPVSLADEGFANLCRAFLYLNKNKLQFVVADGDTFKDALAEVLKKADSELLYDLAFKLKDELEEELEFFFSENKGIIFSIRAERNSAGRVFVKISDWSTIGAGRAIAVIGLLSENGKVEGDPEYYTIDNLVLEVRTRTGITKFTLGGNNLSFKTVLAHVVKELK